MGGNETGFEAAMFTSSGTQANLLGLMAHCERGDEYLCGQQAHNYKCKLAALQYLARLTSANREQPRRHARFKKLAAAIKPNDSHFARTKLLSLENTINGKSTSMCLPGRLVTS
ncbi:beta-eliminating lyase-related protein [Vibrio lentus]|nr:beta-eliminating lyase-related protein [Vibrio lentus]